MKYLILSAILLIMGFLLGFLNPFEFQTKEWWAFNLIINGGAGILLGWYYDAIYRKLTNHQPR